jgi:hypothetical protein
MFGNPVGNSRDTRSEHNLANPQIAEWSTLMTLIHQALSGDSRVHIMLMRDLVKALKKNTTDIYVYVVDENSAIKLLNFCKLLSCCILAGSHGWTCGCREYNTYYWKSFCDPLKSKDLKE